MRIIHPHVLKVIDALLYVSMHLFEQELSEIHTCFYSQLCKAVAPGSAARLSEVFLNWREKFLIYGEYCANLTNAQALIQDVCNRNELVNQQVIVSFLIDFIFL
jgi:hypothetical protein